MSLDRDVTIYVRISEKQLGTMSVDFPLLAKTQAGGAAPSGNSPVIPARILFKVISEPP